MTLSPGQHLSHYTLGSPIGEGGMGIVWRASDSTLGRDVAIKVLPQAVAADPERLARFEREARLLAALNHPNVASIYGFHEDGGVRFLAMELVEGEDLAQRLAHGAIPMADALPLALQIAQALEHAHEKGVVHRDLKPANVKLTSSGQAKVLDFGLAKALADEGGATVASSGALSQSPTVTGLMTGAHVLLGTAAYMSPEQARGQAADRRADIWGFGVLVMEMLSGKRVFEGETISDTLASVLKTEPDWSMLPAATPPRVRALLRRCLERNPKQRLRDIGEARILLEDVLAGRGEEPAASAAPAGSAPRLPLVPIALGALILGALAMYGVTRLDRPRAALPLRKFQAVTPAGEGNAPASPVISPDGRQIAYLLPGRLLLQSLDELEPKSFALEAGASKLFWSPDGGSVGFIAGTRILKMAVDGTEPQAVCDTRGAVSSGGWGACWREDGMIVFSRGDSAGLLEVPASGGDPRSVLKPDSTETDLHEPSALPGGRGVLFSAHHRRLGIHTLWVFAGDRRKLLLTLDGQTIANPVYAASGHILFRRGPTTPGIWALPFSLARLEATGEPFLVAPGATQPSVAGDGTLAYLAGTPNAITQMTWTDAAGRESGTIGPPEEQGGFDPALAPDGRRVARAVSTNDNRDLFIYDTERGTRTRLTFDPATEESPDWSPDGRRIAYHLQLKGSSGAEGYFVVQRAADGTGATDTLAAGVVPRYTPDGRNLVFTALEQSAAFWHLVEVPLDAPHMPRSLVRGNPRVDDGRVAPTGDLMAYMSFESGSWEVFLTRYPSCEGKWQVSTAGGQAPRWSAKGDRLFFAQGDDVMVVDVTHGASPSLGTPRKLFTRFPLGTGAFNFVPAFAVTGDGDRFVTLRGDTRKAGAPTITLVQNWVAEFAKGARQR